MFVRVTRFLGFPYTDERIVKDDIGREWIQTRNRR